MTVEREFIDGVGTIIGKHSLAAFGPDLLAAYRDGTVVAVEDVPSDPRFNPEAPRGPVLAGRSAPSWMSCCSAARMGSACWRCRARSPRLDGGARAILIREVGERVKASIERARAEVALRDSEARLQRSSPARRSACPRSMPRVASFGSTRDVRRILGRTPEELLRLASVADVTDPVFMPRASP